MNKKASLMDGMVWIVIAFITLIVFGGLYIMYDNVYTNFRAVGTTGGINVTNITDTVFKPTHDNMIQNLNIIAFLILAGGAFSILVHNFLVRMHPVWIVAYIIMTVLAVIASAYVSNIYMELLSNEAIGSTLSQLTMSNFIMQYLPYWSAVIGLMGTVFLFIGALRDREISGGIV